MPGNNLYSKQKHNFFKICGVLCDLVAFAQFKKREKYLWRSVDFGFTLQLY